MGGGGSGKREQIGKAKTKGVISRNRNRTYTEHRDEQHRRTQKNDKAREPYRGVISSRGSNK